MKICLWKICISASFLWHE